MNPSTITISGICFRWHRSGFDHSTEPSTPFVVYTCTDPDCFLDVKTPTAELTQHLTDHVRLHRRRAIPLRAV